MRWRWRADFKRVCVLHAARRASDRKRKETDRMAEFMQGTVARTKRQRKQVEHETPEAERVPDRRDRSDAELAAHAARLHDVPRSQWPADVLEYHRRVRREQMRAARAALEEEDRLRREAEQARRREQLGKDDNADDEDGEEAQQRESECCPTA